MTDPLPDSIIEGVRAFIATYSGLGDGALLVVDALGTLRPSYSIVPQPGARVSQWYIDDSSERVYPFALQASFSTIDDATRIGNSAWFEAFADWLESQSNDGSLPALPEGKSASKIEASNWGFLMEQDSSSTGVYQVTCLLTYDQQAPS